MTLRNLVDFVVMGNLALVESLLVDFAFVVIGTFALFEPLLVDIASGMVVGDTPALPRALLARHSHLRGGRHVPDIVARRR